MAVQWNPDPGCCVFFPNHFSSSVPEAVPRLLFFIFFWWRASTKTSEYAIVTSPPRGEGKVQHLDQIKWPRCIEAHVLRMIFFLPVLRLSGPWLFNSARLRKTSTFFCLDNTECKENVKGEHWLRYNILEIKNLRHFKGAHGDRAMRGAQTKMPIITCLQWPESAQVAPRYYFIFVELQVHY